MRTNCRDCDSLTSGRCPRHASWTEIVPIVHIVPLAPMWTTIVPGIVSRPPFMLPVVCPYGARSGEGHAIGCLHVWPWRP